MKINIIFWRLNSRQNLALLDWSIQSSGSKPFGGLTIVGTIPDFSKTHPALIAALPPASSPSYNKITFLVILEIEEACFDVKAVPETETTGYMED